MPDRKNEEVFKVGTPRSTIITEVGDPLSSDTTDSQKREIFRFDRGFSTGEKVGRAIVCTFAIVATLGYADLRGCERTNHTPYIGPYSGEVTYYEVFYDENDCVKESRALPK
jgi:hypothetical protein